MKIEGRIIKYLIFMVLFLSIFIGVFYQMENKGKNKEQSVSQEEQSVSQEEESVSQEEESVSQEEIQSEMTEEFIYRLLENENGTIATYIKDNGDIDEDLVRGRESLAETLGLFMYYALNKDDQTLFDKIYQQLTDYFLNEDGFVNWKLNEDGTSDVQANAFVDDIRILYALVMANERWDEAQYMTTAVLISEYLNEHNVTKGIYTNFYDQEQNYASTDISLSYIDIQGMEDLIERELLDTELVAKTSQVLMQAPLKNGFYPVVYNIEKNEYTYSENINLVDQAILAYHYAQVGHRSEEFLEFIKNEMNERKLIHGMYDLQTKEPTVNYESPAIYGFLILYALEIEENDLAQVIYKRVKEYQVMDEDSEYYGGYSITDGNTHIFDNLVPLLAEQEIKMTE